MPELRGPSTIIGARAELVDSTHVSDRRHAECVRARCVAGRTRRGISLCVICRDGLFAPPVAIVLGRKNRGTRCDGPNSRSGSTAKASASLLGEMPQDAKWLGADAPTSM